MANTAFVFPGQGSQSLGMLSDFVPQYSVISNTFSEASEAIGYDLWQLTQEGPAERLNQTEFTQVAMLTADVAVFRLLMEHGVPSPQLMAGHSLGEYAALIGAGALSLADGVKLVARRGQIMQEAVPFGLGKMAALVGLDDEQVINLCKQASQDDQHVSPANYNAIGQVVVAGHAAAVDRIIHLADEAGALLAKVIPVSVPCHCSLLTKAAEPFAEELAQIDFKTPLLDVISNVDLSVYHSPAHIRTKLTEQLYSPVRWVETIKLFKSRGISFIVECGPGKVLSGLTKRIERSLRVVSVYDTINLDEVVEQYQISA